MNITSLEQVKKFISNFENHSLPKSEWTHEAHFVAGLWYLFHYSFEDAIDIVRENIKSYNISKGVANTDTEGYHETITIFYLKMIQKEILSKHSTICLKAFQDIVNNKITDKNFLCEYYSKDLLLSVNARYNFVKPNLRDEF